MLVTSPRLVLRPLSQTDAQPTAALVTPDVSRNLSTWPSPLGVKQALARIHAARQQLDCGESANLAIVERASNVLIGWIGLARTSESSARLGYWLGAQFRGRGFAKEAVKTFVPVGVRLLQINHVQAFVLLENLASISILEASGFSRDGEALMYMEVRRRHELCVRYTRDIDDC